MATSSLRSRPQSSSKQKDSTSSTKDASDASARLVSAADNATFSVLDILRVIAGLILLSSSISYFVTGDSILWGYRPALTRPVRLKAWFRGPIYITDAELSKYDGSDPELPIYLAINGSIYDVSVSPHFYGPGGGYSFFAGRDATRAYVTGCFDEDLTPDLRGVDEMFIPVDDGGDGDTLTKDEKRARKLRQERERRLAKKKVIDTVAGWEKMFNGGKDGKYFKVGKLKRDEGWEKKLGPVRELCKKAQDGRPKRSAEDSKN